MKFNSNTIESQFIGNLLQNTYIPSIPIIKELKTDVYEYTSDEETGLWSYTKVKTIDNTASIEDNALFIMDRYVYKKTPHGTGESKTYTFDPITQYEFGKRYRNYTYNFPVRNRTYDCSMHEALGKYCRAYSDYYGINLMPFYNCFSSRFIDTFSLPIYYSVSYNQLRGSTYNSNYRLTAFPIRFNTHYTITAVGSILTTVRWQAALYNERSLLNIRPSSKEDTNKAPVSFKMKQGNDIYVSSDEWRSKDDTSLYVNKNIEKYLYVFVEIPTSFDISLVIIEHKENDPYPVLEPSLLNTEASAPFSNRLLEYLTGNVITPIEYRYDDVERIYSAVNNLTFKEVHPGLKTAQDSYIKGVFTEELRRQLYFSLMNMGIEDFNGCVDKDAEVELNKYARQPDIWRVDG